MESPRSRASFIASTLMLASLLLQACSQDIATPAATPRVVIATATPSLAANVGADASIRVLITRNDGFVGPVTLALTGTPANVTAEVPSNPVTGDSATVVLHVGVGVLPGSYPLSLSATGYGFHADAVTLNLQVASQAQTAVDVQFCTAMAPGWVAFQDGDGAWTRWPAVVQDGRMHFSHAFTAGRGAIATVTAVPNSTQTVLRVFYGAAAELASEGDTLRVDCETTFRNWHGQVDGLHADEKALVSSGQLFRVALIPIATEFNLTGMPLGVQDMLSSRTSVATGSAAVTGFILRRAVNLADGAQLPPFNFDSGETFAPVTATLTIEGAGNDAVSSFTELRTVNSRLAMPNLPEQNVLPIRTYVGLPANRLAAGDLQMLHLSTETTGSSSRTADVYYRAVEDRTLTFGARIIPPALAIEQANGTVRPRALFGRFADYDQTASISFAQPGGNAIVSMAMTTSYPLTNGGGFDVSIPDLSGVPGFDANWLLRAGVNATWEAMRVGGSVPLGRGAIPVAGAERRTANVRGTLIVQ